VAVQSSPQELSFQAEAAQILELRTHSLSSSKEIFLRELISSASGAIDRPRLELPARSQAAEEAGPLHIRVGFDPDADCLKEALAGKVADVRDTCRLTDSRPAPGRPHARSTHR
jgi:HSP90 family molecular chaperone